MPALRSEVVILFAGPCHKLIGRKIDEAIPMASLPAVPYMWRTQKNPSFQLIDIEFRVEGANFLNEAPQGSMFVDLLLENDPPHQEH